jgi:hypothetical protein
MRYSINRSGHQYSNPPSGFRKNSRNPGGRGGIYNPYDRSYAYPEERFQDNGMQEYNSYDRSYGHAQRDFDFPNREQNDEAWFRSHRVREGDFENEDAGFTHDHDFGYRDRFNDDVFENRSRDERSFDAHPQYEREDDFERNSYRSTSYNYYKDPHSAQARGQYADPYENSFERDTWRYDHRPGGDGYHENDDRNYYRHRRNFKR